MAQNLKLLAKLNKRVLTKIELSRLERANIGTREIEKLARKIQAKEVA